MMIIDQVKWIMYIIGLMGFLWFILKNVFIIIEDKEIIILQKLGKYEKTLKSGIHIINPILEELKTVNWSRKVELPDGKITIETFEGYRIPLCEQSYDPPPFICYTKDNIEVKVNLVTNFIIESPLKAVYDIDNVWLGMENILSTQLINIMTDVLSSEINSTALEGRLLNGSNAEIENWGVCFTKVKIQGYKLPVSISDLLQKNNCSQQIAYTQQQQLKLDTQTFEYTSKLENSKLQQKIHIETLQLNHKLEMERLQNEARLKLLEDEQKIKNNPENREILLAQIQADVFAKIIEKANTIVIPYESSKYFGSNIQFTKNVK